MKRIIVGIMTSIALTFSAVVQAHEGHDTAPGAATAPNGGTVKGTSKLFVEVVYDSGKVKVFLYDHDMKKINLDSIKAKASVKLPKASKAVDLKLTQVNDFLEGKVETKGAHRFALNISIQKDGKSEKISFNIEP